MIMSNEFVSAIHNGKNLEAEDAFKSAMQDKVGAALASNFTSNPHISPNEGGTTERGSYVCYENDPCISGFPAAAH